MNIDKERVRNFRGRECKVKYREDLKAVHGKKLGWRLKMQQALDYVVEHHSIVLKSFRESVIVVILDGDEEDHKENPEKELEKDP